MKKIFATLVAGAIAVGCQTAQKNDTHAENAEFSGNRGIAGLPTNPETLEKLAEVFGKELRVGSKTVTSAETFSELVKLVQKDEQYAGMVFRDASDFLKVGVETQIRVYREFKLAHADWFKLKAAELKTVEAEMTKLQKGFASEQKTSVAAGTRTAGGKLNFGAKVDETDTVFATLKRKYPNDAALLEDMQKQVKVIDEATGGEIKWLAKKDCANNFSEGTIANVKKNLLEPQVEAAATAKRVCRTSGGVARYVGQSMVVTQKGVLSRAPAAAKEAGASICDICYAECSANVVNAINSMPATAEATASCGE